MPMPIERISGPRPASDWSYVVRRVGSGSVSNAIEVRMRREGARLVLVGVERHLRVPVAEFESDPVAGSEAVCDLVGGACQLHGGLLWLQVEALFETHGDVTQLGWEQPESLWVGLEEMLL